MVESHNLKQNQNRIQNQNLNLKIITHVNPKSPVAEAYRILRTNLNFVAVDKPFKSVMVTSAGPAEGKSTTMANLGVAMAQAGVKTLVVDCDMRRPRQHKIFELPNTKGFTNLLADRGIALEEVIRDTAVPGLKVITSGPIPPNPSELLASKQVKSVIEELESRFQLVLFDSPPVVAVADAAILASQVDGVLVVIRAHQTKQNLAESAKNLLDKASANIIGIVLNGIPMSGEDYYYYYYYGQGADGKKGLGDRFGRSSFSRMRRIVKNLVKRQPREDADYD